MPADNQKCWKESNQGDPIMTITTAVPVHFIGCDVGKTSIVVFDSRTGETRSIANRPADLARFAATLDDTCLAVCEAIGGYEDA